ncbi:MAG: hypothetical protein LBC47_06540 [Tannerella sp.]|nr:hypothetical protein [Tannerella sp.]
MTSIQMKSRAAVAAFILIAAGTTACTLKAAGIRWTGTASSVFLKWDTSSTLRQTVKQSMNK